MLKRKRLLFLLILVIAICLRFIYLDKGYNSDEGWLLRTAGLDLNKLIPFLEQGRSVYPPLSPFLLHFWLKLGISEVWVRGYFVLFGVALCILIYHLGKLFLNERFGMIAFFISAISPLLIWSSQFIRSYIDSAFWVILSIYFMLRILKGANFWRNSLGYVVSSAFALYSSYLNGLILISQSIFIFAFYLKDLKFLRRWMALQVLVGIIFIPCLSLLLKQLKLATAIDPKWSERGFQLFGINVGYHARSVAAAFGMDPDFLTMSPLTQKLNKIALVSLAGLAFCAVIWLFVSAIRNLKEFFKDKQLAWFFPVLSISGLVLYDILVEVMNFPLQAEYFIPQHVLFLFVISAFVYSVKENDKFKVLALSLISIVFILRFHGAIKPEFETKKAYNYLASCIKTSDCLLMVRNTNRYIEPETFNIVLVYDYIQKDSDADYYKPLDERAKMMFSSIKKKYTDIWFYRSYGNDEILGANRLIMDWLKENGYTIEDVQKFRRIDVIHYKSRE